jgi:hypothetical protein
MLEFSMNSFEGARLSFIGFILLQILHDSLELRGMIPMPPDGVSSLNFTPNFMSNSMSLPQANEIAAPVGAGAGGLLQHLHLNVKAKAKPPKKPKQAPNSYIIFCEELREKEGETLKGLKDADRFRYFGKKWRELSVDDRQKYKEKEVEARREYEEQLDQYENECSAPRKFKEQMKSAVKMKKPPNAYTMFVQKVAERLKKDKPELQWKEILTQASGEYWPTIARLHRA